MSNHLPASTAFCDTKPHYDLLDGLRGVAALLVVCYHVFEGYAFAGQKPYIVCINHGYLAVDFFFILSGFVIGYAYDDRWNRTLTMKGFFQRRLIRLHPMVIMGAVLGTITFLVQGSVQWDGRMSPPRPLCSPCCSPCASFLPYRAAATRCVATARCFR